MKKCVTATDGCCIIEIDIKRLYEMGHQIFITNRAHKFVTNFVPPECILLHKVRPEGVSLIAEKPS